MSSKKKRDGIFVSMIAQTIHLPDGQNRMSEVRTFGAETINDATDKSQLGLLDFLKSHFALVKSKTGIAEGIVGFRISFTIESEEARTMRFKTLDDNQSKGNKK